jgi:hypothetical protein
MSQYQADWHSDNSLVSTLILAEVFMVFLSPPRKLQE